MSSDGEDFIYDDEDEFDDFEDEHMDSESEPDVFDAVSPTAEDGPSRKPYDVAYKVLSPKELTEMQNIQVKKVQTLLEVPASSAAILLRHYAWNSEKLQEEFWSDPAGSFAAAGLSPPSSPSTSTASLPMSSPFKSRNPFRPKNKKAAPFDCPICCNDYPTEEFDTQTYSLGCNHRFCRACWKEYLTGKIKTEGESARVQCMESGCNRVVVQEAVEELVEPDVAVRYRDLLQAAYVQDSPSLRWCPHPGCQYAIECSQAPPRMLNQIVPTVTCTCGHDLCFGCGYPADHRPVLCKIVKAWEKKCADDSETANWLNANTKECPKCQSTIEKNGGCNHMTCKKCRGEFCWVCMGPWSEHGTSWYQCNRFDEKSGSDARDAQAKSRASLERYLHFFNRFANHDQSAKLDADFYKNTEKKMEIMQNNGNLSWIEVQFAKEAVKTVVRSRILLKWSYGMAYYLVRNNMTELFEDNQRDLERAVETLSGLLESNIAEQDIAKIRFEITNQAAYVQKRHDILLDDTLKGYLEHRWLFTIDI
ncbi:hypothetical protein CcaverHIS002_0702640 [Cutaneotrichosporon cavernicola]|uniref:RBR-type E3 ubiquitin transferase n=1 Tax=Cutaneotrichosporon cavernicola TaxID=279322 RepID=A0AA48LA66_9TREE|nr:uncharacterized protein CcaverHIS019_0702720 [Cutaneotrichosporon cavernicola]BEI86918.1 hypothetical protein CcaverHIS002_0702640 [Cutaneotrichosporon cavernicola]BEI94691.1 hypothetical protein CcaverHIS019_0702720 [Cutaneotrichosporon cavernicola]BEJ02466.1 hypothetical protein CcaverHIS631_0702610 [Cutaneotrichosporon cavernicola]BEJ10225.1 hypothetical protein CcaverHIS641_0702600 [Cutaneotrichosporon cavernicola]